MAIPMQSLVKPEDVFALTQKGEAELKGSRTALQPAALELLVRMDGKTSVGKILEDMRAAPSQELMAGIAKLLSAGHIDRASRVNDGMIEFDPGPGASTPSPDAVSHATREAGAGLSSLEQQGYYVRIARAPGERPVLPLDRKPVAVIIEDEPSLAGFLKHLVRFENFEVRTAANREEVMQAFREPPRPDLVLLDVMLPDADGFDILAKIRQHPALATVPVIMLTAKATREAVIKGLAGGANGYITKPFQIEVLVKAIQTLFGRAHDSKGDTWESSR